MGLKIGMPISLSQLQTYFKIKILEPNKDRLIVKRDTKGRIVKTIALSI